MLDIERAFDNYKEITKSIDNNLSEMDTRVKIIDTIFKECLGWSEDDIKREEHIHKGFIDYVFLLNNIPMFTLEAKKIGTTFEIPISLGKRKYKINGVISNNKPIQNAIEQVARYSQESGVTFSIVSNGVQFIIFENFKRGGKWRESSCMCFHSLEDIMDNFGHFWNILSKESVSQGSLKRYISGEIAPLEYTRPLDEIHDELATRGRNFLAPSIEPLIKNVFADLTDDSQIQILKDCYISQKEIYDYNGILRLKFDKLPYYAKEYDINDFKETETTAGDFQISFNKCVQFLTKETPRGSLFILLGGIGSGKTTFIHHFFKITMENRDDIIWFYVNFGVSPPDLDEIEEYIYQKIIEKYKSYYSSQFQKEEKNFGIDDLQPSRKDILILFTMLRYLGRNISLVLDNVDQHSYTSPLYQEKVFEYAEHITSKLRTITILNLREESFFRATQSGVLDAYMISKYHISSPNFENLIRKRLKHVMDLLDENSPKINEIYNLHMTELQIQNLKVFIRCLNYSLRKNRKVGEEILEFINDISGGNMRQALRYFTTYMISGNTDVDEMYNIEGRIDEKAPPWEHYQIPLHHLIKSIIIGDNRYYGSERSFIMNLFQINPLYTNSHFIHLKILKYLFERINYFIKLDYGFIDIKEILYQADRGGLNQSAISDSLKKLALKGLVEFENQNKNGYADAEFVRITQTGKYYLTNLVHKFGYLDLMFGDTPISDSNVVKKLKNSFKYDNIRNKIERIEKRFDRTEIFINYLKEQEIKDFENNPFIINSDLTNQQFIDDIYNEVMYQKKEILEKLTHKSFS